VDLGFFKGSGRYLGVAEIMAHAYGSSLLLLNGVTVRVLHILITILARTKLPVIISDYTKCKVLVILLLICPLSTNINST